MVRIDVGLAQRFVKEEDRYVIGDLYYAVFDGLGGHRDGGVAAEIAKNVFSAFPNYRAEFTCGETLDMLTESFAAFLSFVSETVARATEGLTTCVAARIVEVNGGLHMVWANAGDSRLYICRDGKAIQVSEDESGAMGWSVANCLGRDNGGGVRIVSQCGYFPLSVCEKVILCSDGITGDTREEALSEDVIYELVAGVSVQEAADNLLMGSRKYDDKTVIVLQVV
ncbi:protein phosphatase 2C domain-containing protein [Candidatus Saccharibacteria bacterium]|nr:protein phosphatase 2C domain-containing protein [Candidatus Saccharibacteria bacterium]